MRRVIVLVAACSHGGGVALDPDPKPQAQLADVATSALCVSMGKLDGASIDVPTFRAVAPGHAGDAAAAKVLVHGASSDARALASGQLRRQLGLKLRAQDGCNLVYVMWRLDPKPKLDVSVKRNAGARTAKECGNGGYTKVKPAWTGFLPGLEDRAPHELRAEIHGDELDVWIDGKLQWQGALPAAAKELAGPAGFRSDNLAFDLVAFSADARAGGAVDAKCKADDEPAE